MKDALHPSHRTRFSDSSMYDFKCVLCGATDETGGGWGSLKYECGGSEEARKSYDDEAAKLDAKIDNLERDIKHNLSRLSSGTSFGASGRLHAGDVPMAGRGQKGARDQRLVKDGPAADRMGMDTVGVLVDAGKYGLGNNIYQLWVQDNGFGGRAYWCEEIGGGVRVWDTCLVSEEAMIAALKAEGADLQPSGFYKWGFIVLSVLYAILAFTRFYS